MNKTVELQDEPETTIAIDNGENNIVVAVAISKYMPDKSLRGCFWRGQGIKHIRCLYGHMRRKLQEKWRIGKIERLNDKKRRMTDQQLHAIFKQIISNAMEFPNAVIGMKDQNRTQCNSNDLKEVDRRFSWPLRKSRTAVGYKVLLEGTGVKYLTNKDIENVSNTCQRCVHISWADGNVYKRPKCGMRYDRVMNASINMPQKVVTSIWSRREAIGLADMFGEEKPRTDAGIPSF